MTASPLPREIEVQSRLRNVSTFSRYARVVCAALFGFGLVGSIVVLLIGVLGAIFFPESRSGSGFTAAQKAWILPIVAATFAVLLTVVYQFYLLFGSLAAGAVYTAENVRRVRRVGHLSLLSAVLSVLIPVAWAALVALGVIEPSGPPKFEVGSWLPQALSSFVAAGLILLVSWIMDIGLYEKDHAAALQREADLVI